MLGAWGRRGGSTARQVRLRHRPMRRLHRAHRRRGRDALLLAAGQRGRRRAKITTIEGLAQNGVLHKVQKAWLDHDVPQCGYCQSGMIMAVAALLKEEAEADRRRHRRQHHQHLPLRHLPAGARGDPRRRERVRGGRHELHSENESPHVRRERRGRRRRAGARPRVPFGGPQAIRAADGTPEINAWVVIRPDDTVVIRVARSGDGPGHAHRPRPARRRGARMRLVEGHDRISDARPERRPQARVGRLLHRRQPRHPHVARICAQGRRRGARDAHAGGGQRVEGAGLRGDRGQQRDHAQGRPAAPPPTARWPRRPPSSSRRRTSSSRTRRTGRSPASRSSGSTPPTRSPASRSTASTSSCPACSTPPIKECPVFGGKVKSFDAAKVAGMPGVKKVVQVGDTAVAVVADTWWQAKTALDALPIVWDEGDERQGLERLDRRVAQGRPRRPGGVCRQPERRRQGRDRRRGQEGRGGLRLSLPEPRLHGADERHRALHAGQVRGVGSDAERRSRVRGDRWRRRACRPTSARSTRSTSAAASAGAARSTTTPRGASSPSRCRARR